MMLGCATMIAAVPFTLALIVAMFATGGNLGLSLGIAAEVAAMTLLASTILFGLDRWRQKAKWGRVRRRLASRPDTSADQFAASFPPMDRELALHLRDRLAEFFDEPGARIGANDRLDEFGFEKSMPQIYIFLMAALCDRSGIESLGSFPKGKLTTVVDLVVEARALLKEKPAKFAASADDLDLL
jgi:hypothetical protein